MFKIRIFQGNELQREKQKDYRNIVILQIIIIVLGLTLSEFVLSGTDTPVARLVISVFSMFGALYAYLMWDLLRNFTAQRWLINTYLGILVISIGTGILGEFPYYKIIEVSDRQSYLLVIHLLLFLIEVTVIGFAIRDIFTGDYLTPDKLWGGPVSF